MTEKSLNIVFMGTPEFSVASLRAILGSRHKVSCIYTQPPRPKGRGQQLQKSPVHLVAESAGIPVRHPQSLKRDEVARQDFVALQADVAVVAAYGLILPLDVLTAPRFGCVNIHASLLPRWRGASPIQRSIIAGDAESGVTLMRMEEGLDTGPMIEKRATPIGPETTSSTLHDALSTLGADMIVPFLDRLSDMQKIDSETQDDSQTCYAPLLTKEESRVDWSNSAIMIDRQIRALNPWPGVWAEMDGKRVKIIAAKPSAEIHGGAVGILLDRDGRVVCGSGTVLHLLIVQPESAKPMAAHSAINGRYLIEGKPFT